jgi:lipopolysaccharide export system protein LptA
MTARKLFILLVTVAILLVMYLIYGYFNNAPILVIDRGSGRATDANVREAEGTMGKIGSTRVGTVVKAVYTELDKNKNVKREFGFEKLLHESGNEWTLQKPYMNIIEKNFVCGITADTGKVQVEMAGGKPAPKDAQLLGNVIIHILPDKGARMSESFVYLDDVSFISEKSLFTTAGPVRFVSADAEMNGKGLEVIYNPDKDRLELMHLVDLESLRLKTFRESMFTQNSGDPGDNPAGSTAGAPETNQTKKASAAPDGQKSSEQYYRCTLSKNVVVNYGSQAVLADEVTIRNLFWPKNKKTSDKEPSSASANAASSAKDANGTGTASGSAAGIIPIVITCENGVVMRPMEEAVSGANAADMSQRTLELSGTPVVIKAGDIAGVNARTDEGSGSRVLAECGWLKYNLDLGVLDMFSSGQQKYVSLNLEQDGSKLETTNSLRWSVKDRKAVVRGPGTLYLGARQSDNDGLKKNLDNARMNFGGTMDVNFADESKQDLQQAMNIRSIYMAGGFTAAMHNDTSHLAADSATFSFAKGNAIAEANLDGNVNFNSDSGSLKTQKAKFLFAADNTLSEADLDGGVDFNSNSGSGSSQNAKVLFGKGNAISEAQLDGDVNFDSGTGSLKSEKAKVLFTKDSKGNVYASCVQSFGNVEIIPANAKGRTPRGVFRAQRIDYDIPKGYALADGPVELTFDANAASVNDANSMPVTITAKQKAEYFLKSNEVIFQGDVEGTMIKNAGGSSEYNEFHGDRLVAKLGRVDQNKAAPAGGQAGGIDHLSISGDVVKFESYQKQKGDILGGVKLKCRQVDYDGVNNGVWASGGKDCFVFIDNSKAALPEKSGSSFDLKGPSNAILMDFEKLEWSMKDNRIVADGIPAGMHITYLPIVQGKDDKKIQIDSSHAQIDLAQTPDGRNVIAGLKATGGIHYLEENNYEFYGNELNYDGKNSIISIVGDSLRPCIANGVLGKSITINLSNGSGQVEGLTGGSAIIPPKKAK